MPRKRTERTQDGNGRRQTTSAESIAFLLLGGIALGFAVGAGIDWLVGSFPLCAVIGVFAGFALALYAVYLETK